MNALDGLKVVDFAWVVAGPLVGRALADYGATVVRVESGTRVDTARVLGPFPGGRLDRQASTAFDCCNANKLGITLDLRSDEGRAVARDLVAWADVAIESFLPGQMARFGLDYPRLRAINPGLVMLSSSLTGQSGPTAHLAGFGNIGAALSGIQNIVGLEDELPLGPFGPYTDYIAPRMALMALLAALDRRRRTGEGCHLDISQVESAIALLAPQLLDHQETGRVARARGNRDERYVPNGAFAAAGEDRWVAISVRSDAEWRRLAALIGGTGLADDPRFADEAGRRANEDALEAIVAHWTAARSEAAIEEALQAIGVPAHRVADSRDVVSDPQLAHRGAFVRVADAARGETVIDAARFRLSDTPPVYARAAPTTGRDTDAVLRDVLGYPAERIATLRGTGALD